MMFASTRLFNFKLSPVLGVQEVLNIIEVPAFGENIIIAARFLFLLYSLLPAFF